jgi:DNA-binding CsgD family transcriptional regulator
MASRGEEILLLASSGLTDKEIADQLCISVRTVEGHWRRLREQSGKSNRAGLIGEMLRQEVEKNGQILEEKTKLFLRDIESLHTQNQQLKQQAEAIAEQARNQSAILQQELGDLYKEVNSLKSQNLATEQLNSIVLKGNVLAFRISAEPPYDCAYMSDSIRSIGYRPSDFTDGHIPITSLVHPEDFASIWADSLQQIKSGTHRLERKYRLITTRGESRIVLDRCVYEEASSDYPSTLSIFAFDITHTQYAEILGNHFSLK